MTKLMKFIAEVELYVIATDEEAVREAFGKTENLLEYATGFRFGEPKLIEEYVS